MITSLVTLIIVGFVLGLFYWLIGVTPVLPGIFKQVLQWLIILIAVLVLVNFLLQLAGQPGFIPAWR